MKILENLLSHFIRLLHFVEHFAEKMLRKREKQSIAIDAISMLPLHGAHVGAPKLKPIAFEPHITHSCLGHHARCLG